MDAPNHKPPAAAASPLTPTPEIGMSERPRPSHSDSNSNSKSNHVILDIPHNPDPTLPTSSSPDISSAGKPPKIPTPHPSTLTRLQSLSSKPKSRFGQPSLPLPNDSDMFDEIPSTRASPISTRTLSLTPTTPLISSPAAFDEGEEIYKRVSSRRQLRYKKLKSKVFIEWLLFLCILASLVATLTLHKLQNLHLWSLHLWKWCVLVLVTFSGLLVTKWLVHFVVLLIELNYMLKKKVMYFVHGLKKSVRVFIWLALVLITWVLLFQQGAVQRTRTTTRVLKFITWTIAALLIGSFLWVLKSLLLKILASSFHVNTFFDRIQESITHQYILFTLSGPPVMDSAQMLGKTRSIRSQFSFRIAKKSKERKEGKEKGEKGNFDIHKLHKLKQEKVSAWTMKMLVDGITNSGFTTISNVIDDNDFDGSNEQMDKEITNEEEAIAAAYHIFRNVAQQGCKYIDEYDLCRFMIKEEVELVFPMIDAAGTGQIDRKALTEWVVKVYKSRTALAHALNDTKTAVKQLNKLVTFILIVIMVVIWLLLTGIATTKVLVFLSSQLVLAAFMFGNTCKTIFEAIIFVFVMHPFDVGDRCVVDGIQMIVEEMNILTTVFLKADNEKVYYPNSVLATKPISNFYRSPDMSDSFEFCIDFRTPMEKIGALKERIKKHLEKNPTQWYPHHSVVVKEIENINKIKMVVFFNHTMNFQDFPEKNRRRTEFVLEMKRVFEELNIRYDLLPQEVCLLDSKMPISEITK